MRYEVFMEDGSVEVVDDALDPVQACLLASYRRQKRTGEVLAAVRAQPWVEVTP